jgi:hypothetical protein
MQSVKNLYVIIAREVTTDVADKMNSIIKIIDKFTFNVNRDELEKNEITLGSQQIGLPANYSVATSWIFGEKLKKESFFNFKIDIYDPAGKKLDKGPEQENLLPAGIDRINMNFNVQGLPVTTEGIYKLRAEIESKDKKLHAKADYPFTVEFVDGPAVQIA